MPASPEQTSLAHMVFFTLKDRSEAARNALVQACRKYLSDHPGTVYFCAGPRAELYQRPVNDTLFDVALVLVFATDEDHQRYQTSEPHQQFIAEQLENCSQVRVFDALA
jgi:hypothetical protein